MPKMTYDIRRGFIGADVVRLQNLLNDELEAGLVVDGVYGGGTFNAVKRFEEANDLPVTGQCAGATLAKARDRGFKAVEFDVTDANKGPDWPGKPSSATLAQPTAQITATLFGTFQFEHQPLPKDPEHIRILGNWSAQNIVSVMIPQLAGVPIPLPGNRTRISTGEIWCHKLAKNRLLQLFAAWDEAGLSDRILTFDGSFNPRLKRGRTVPIKENLSNHSWGATVDINAGLNPMHSIPALMGRRGCIRELAVIANRMGIYWGGHFGTNPNGRGRDGMHFEAAKL